MDVGAIKSIELLMVDPSQGAGAMNVITPHLL